VSKATALVLEGPGNLDRYQLALPEIADDDALLRVEACGLCGTDHELYSGHLEWPVYGFIPGHETVGVIEEIGPTAAERWGVTRGDRVAVEIFLSCRSCGRCHSGDYKHCERHGPGEMYGFLPVGRAPGLWGGYATHHYLAPDSMILPIPAGLDPVVATFFNPLGAGVKWVTQVGALQPGEVVAILGPGVRGIAGVIAAKHGGAGFVMVTGYGARDAARLEVALELGADLVVDTAVSDPVEALRAATGRGADLVVDVTANAPSAFIQCLDLATQGGRIVVAGMRGPGEVRGFAPDLILTKELRIQGTMGIDISAYRPALELLVQHADEIARLPRQTAGFDAVGDLLAVMAGSGSAPPLHAVLVP
jgi:alcohol dehydrogenase